MRKATALTAAILATLFAGCTALPTASDYDLKWLAEIAGQDEGPPVQIVAIWTDASLKQAGSPDTRGFGGRIYLYDSQQRPVEADGELIVYAFLERDRQPPSKHPERKFVFKADELKEHYSKTALGHSYSIWLPWDRAGDDTVSVSLVPTFKPSDEDAKAVIGAPSLNVLKGKAVESTLEKMEVTAASGVRPVSYDADDDEAAREGRSRRRVSIFDPQTNVVTGPLPRPVADVRGAAFESDLPRASGISTATFDLPRSMGLAMKQAPPASPRQSAAAKPSTPQPTNGQFFDLARIAAIADAAAQAKALGAEGGASQAAGASRAASASRGAGAGEDEEEVRINRFNSRKRSPPTWVRNRPQRWEPVAR